MITMMATFAQAIQDAYCLARKLEALNNGEYKSLEEALQAYESIRKPPTSAIMQSSRLIGWVETQAGFGSLCRDIALWFAGKIGVPKQVFVNGAIPRIDDP
ncbi:hypothetical protein CYMTET_40154 [Cymbomonas tetramitiformis]|uniref:Uncharacterized protein n=1 Tax=Cymbomonas tetramitiformis TaxID=36881 RepID=A0AAE0CAV0_9CHLO|nr:hypothetical protein CYMTET_40154 [Cymbomonas tetramitiformis]